MSSRNLSKDFRLRLTPEQFDFLVSRSSALGLSPSEYLRRVLDAEERALRELPRMRDELSKQLDELYLKLSYRSSDDVRGS